MIWHKEPFFPPHEDGTSITVARSEQGLLEVILYVLEGWETLPVHHVFLFSRTPVLSEETISAANNFGIKISGEFWPILC
jgi:hypothetical protein